MDFCIPALRCVHSGQVGRCGSCESGTVVSDPRDIGRGGCKEGDKEGRAHISCFSLFGELLEALDRPQSKA